MAEICAFLCSPAARYINGAVHRRRRRAVPRQLVGSLGHGEGVAFGTLRRAGRADASPRRAEAAHAASVQLLASRRADVDEPRTVLAEALRLRIAARRRGDAVAEEPVHDEVERSAGSAARGARPRARAASGTSCAERARRSGSARARRRPSAFRTQTPTLALPPLSPERAPQIVPSGSALGRPAGRRRGRRRPRRCAVRRRGGGITGGDGDRLAADHDPVLDQLRRHERRPVDAVRRRVARRRGDEEAGVVRERHLDRLVAERAPDLARVRVLHGHAAGRRRPRRWCAGRAGRSARARRASRRSAPGRRRSVQSVSSASRAFASMSRPVSTNVIEFR